MRSLARGCWASVKAPAGSAAPGCKAKPCTCTLAVPPEGIVTEVEGTELRGAAEAVLSRPATPIDARNTPRRIENDDRSFWMDSLGVNKSYLPFREWRF